MITVLKKRTKPLALQKLEAANSRLHPHFPGLDRLQRDLNIRYKGYIGEKQVDYHLRYLQLRCTILQDVSLQVQDRRIQIDTMIITEYAIFLIEIKNYNGTIIFDTDLNQFTRTEGDHETGFRHPVTQAENQKLHFISWLHENNFCHIPVHYFIAISDPATIIKVKGDQKAISSIVMHAENLPGKIKETDQRIGQISKAKVKSREIGKGVLQACREFDVDILRKYNVKKNDILRGIHCPHCFRFAMIRKKGKWYCPDCEAYSQLAHLKALADYFLLIKPSITNKECTEFFQITSRHVTSRLLKNSKLNYDPKTKSWHQNN